jgi:Lrp/AsnC family transcriptional regulator for asnA, asnC and gidA
MDRLDVRIVTHLQNDGNSTNAGIARKVGVSEETVRRRLKKLTNDGFVKVVAIPNARKMGYASQVVIGLQVDAAKVDEVAAALADMPEITWVSVTTGTYDIFVWATLKSAEALSEFLRKRVGQTKGVRRMETFISLELRKSEYGINMESVTV